MCRHWVFNECHKGNECTYKHEWDMENMPDCEYGSHCTRASCPLKHPPKTDEVIISDIWWTCRGSVYSTNRDFVHMERIANISIHYLELWYQRHIRYADGDLPITIDVSCRDRENDINPKVTIYFQYYCRKRLYSKQAFVETNVIHLKRQENVNMVKTVFIVTILLTCAVLMCFECDTSGCLWFV